MPEYTTEVNSLGTLRLLDAIKASEIRTKLFSLSSPYMFSGKIYPQNEETVLEPKSPYAVTKVYAYQMGKCYRENYNLFVTNGICYNHESPMRDESFVAMKIVSYAKMIRSGKKKVLELGNLNARREWGHAIDYAYAMWLTLQQDKPNDYVISTGEAYTVREFAEKVYAKIGIAIDWIGNGLDEKGVDLKTGETLIVVSKKYIRLNDADVLVGNSQKFVEDTGYNFKYDLDKMIDSLLEE